MKFGRIVLQVKYASVHGLGVGFKTQVYTTSYFLDGGQCRPRPTLAASENIINMHS